MKRKQLKFKGKIVGLNVINIHTIFGHFDSTELERRSSRGSPFLLKRKRWSWSWSWRKGYAKGKPFEGIRVNKEWTSFGEESGVCKWSSHRYALPPSRLVTVYRVREIGKCSKYLFPRIKCNKINFCFGKIKKLIFRAGHYSVQIRFHSIQIGSDLIGKLLSLQLPIGMTKKSSRIRVRYARVRYWI